MMAYAGNDDVCQILRRLDYIGCTVCCRCLLPSVLCCCLLAVEPWFRLRKRVSFQNKHKVHTFLLTRMDAGTHNLTSSTNMGNNAISCIYEFLTILCYTILFTNLRRHSALDFSIDLIQPHYDSEVDSAYKRNEYQDSSWG
jgi:hypothetical protein